MTMRAKYLRIPPETWKSYQTKERPSGWSPPWFKLHSKILDNRGLRKMDAAERWVYIGILCLANESGNNVESDEKSLAYALTTSPLIIRKAVRTLVKNGFIEPVPPVLVDKVSKQKSQPFGNGVVPHAGENLRGKRIEKDKGLTTEARDPAETALADINRNLRGTG